MEEEEDKNDVNGWGIESKKCRGGHNWCALMS